MPAWRASSKRHSYFGKPRVASCSFRLSTAAPPRPPTRRTSATSASPATAHRHLKLARRIAGGPLAPGRQAPGWSEGAKAWDRRPWASTAAPPQALFGIHVARALFSGPEGRPEPADGPLSGVEGGRVGCCEQRALRPCRHTATAMMGLRRRARFIARPRRLRYLVTVTVVV
jgi:hypothetical protein